LKKTSKGEGGFEGGRSFLSKPRGTNPPPSQSRCEGSENPRKKGLKRRRGGGGGVCQKVTGEDEGMGLNATGGLANIC